MLFVVLISKCYATKGHLYRWALTTVASVVAVIASISRSLSEKYNGPAWETHVNIAFLSFYKNKYPGSKRRVLAVGAFVFLLFIK